MQFSRCQPFLLQFADIGIWNRINSYDEKQCKVSDKQNNLWMEQDGSGGINDKPCVFKLTMFWYCHWSFADYLT